MGTDNNTSDNPLYSTKEEKDESFKKEAMPHRQTLLEYAKNICKSHFDAEDLVQDTMARAYRFFDKYEPNTNCQAWLFTILKNLYNNRYKKYKRTPDKVEYGETEKVYNTMTDDNERFDMNPEKGFFKNVLSDKVVESFNKLSLEFRLTLIFVDVHDFSYEEVAELIDCPIGTVMSRLHRSRNVLQEFLEDYAEEKGVISDYDGEKISYN
jgi:RNA polymerase sigma-70 factor (ECF subfamily)